MKPRHVLVRRLLFVLLLITGVLLLGWGLLHCLFDAMFAPVEASEQQLVYRTDHQKILEACRWIEANRITLGVKRGMIDGVEDAAIRNALPDAGRNLQFELIYIDDSGVKIFFGGGFAHWGFLAPHSDAPEQDASSTARRWQLIPGLWFWNEWGKFPPDPAKPTRVRTSTLQLVGGAVAFVSGVLCLRIGRNHRTGSSRS